MSHNVQIKGIKISNLDALESACAELRTEGVAVQLDRGTGSRSLKFRTYQSYSIKNDDRADHVIRLAADKFDIGLVRQPGGFYQPVYDDMLGVDLPCSIACAYKPGEPRNLGHAMGKLMQRYSATLAEMDAKRRGFISRRVVGENGTLQVVING